MKYQILARKWRPKNFNDVIGQKYVIKALSNSISLKRIHQTWLLTGARGTGKTTIARILAKNLCCEKGISIQACGQCSICLEIEQGNFIDLIEVDAASKTKVEEIKALLENIKYQPMKSRFKIFLIDEIHMLSRYSFNALLKILEEPPKHVKFILATTEIKKLPKTIISRCMVFYLKKIKEKYITENIKKILNYEKILSEVNALNLIAESSKGSMRDALNLLELTININRKKITKKNVTKILGKMQKKKSLFLFITLLTNKKKNLILLLNKISESNIDWSNVLIEILRILHHIAMIKSFKKNWSKQYKLNKKNLIMKKIAYHIPEKIIYGCYKIITISFKELKYAPSKRLGVEITLLRILYYMHKKNKDLINKDFKKKIKKIIKVINIKKKKKKH